MDDSFCATAKIDFLTYPLETWRIFLVTYMTRKNRLSKQLLNQGVIELRLCSIVQAERSADLSGKVRGNLLQVWHQENSMMATSGTLPNDLLRAQAIATTPCNHENLTTSGISTSRMPVQFSMTQLEHLKSSPCLLKVRRGSCVSH